MNGLTEGNTKLEVCSVPLICGESEGKPSTVIADYEEDFEDEVQQSPGILAAVASLSCSAVESSQVFGSTPTEVEVRQPAAAGMSTEHLPVVVKPVLKHRREKQKRGPRRLPKVATSPAENAGCGELSKTTMQEMVLLRERQQCAARRVREDLRSLVKEQAEKLHAEQLRIIAILGEEVINVVPARRQPPQVRALVPQPASPPSMLARILGCDAAISDFLVGGGVRKTVIPQRFTKHLHPERRLARPFR
jgi:hypothetical protein